MMSRQACLCSPVYKSCFNKHPYFYVLGLLNAIRIKGFCKHKFYTETVAHASSGCCTPSCPS